MKKTLITTLTVLLIGFSTAVVGGSEPEEGELAITGTGSSASSTTAVGPNGTSYNSKIEMTGRNPNISIGNTVENVTHDGKVSSFQGYIQASTPCHVLEQQTTETEENSYKINIQTVVENASQVCTQQLVMIKYDGSFEAETPYTLEISHNNQKIETIEAGDTSNPNPAPENKTKEGGLVSEIMKWFRNLF